jgi:hypothetical protein
MNRRSREGGNNVIGIVPPMLKKRRLRLFQGSIVANSAWIPAFAGMTI